LNQLDIQNIVKRKDLSIATIDATRIGLEILGTNITNTVILGSLVQVSHLFTLEQLSDAIIKRFKGEIAAKNVQAVKMAYDETCTYESGVDLDFHSSTKVLWQQVELGLPGYKELDKAGVWYCDEKSIEVGSAQVNTGSWGEWDVIWDDEKCTDCGQCWFICPDFSIVRKKGEDGKWHMAGIDTFHCKACLNCVNICPVDAISKRLKQGPASCAAPE
jgi:2-oxoacid:acceptor oxidoreductase delta subunit (pyruvate/2-ketoisovalerate family)